MPSVRSARRIGQGIAAHDGRSSEIAWHHAIRQVSVLSQEFRSASAS